MRKAPYEVAPSPFYGEGRGEAAFASQPICSDETTMRDHALKEIKTMNKRFYTR